MITRLIDTLFLALILFGIPLAALIWFVVSLVRFLRRNKNDEEQSKNRKKHLILSLTLSSVLLLIVGGLFLLLMLSLSKM